MTQPKLGWGEVRPADLSARSAARRMKAASRARGPLFGLLLPRDDALAAVHLQIMEGGLRFRHNAIINAHALPSLARIHSQLVPVFQFSLFVSIISFVTYIARYTLRLGIASKLARRLLLLIVLLSLSKAKLLPQRLTTVAGFSVVST